MFYKRPYVTITNNDYVVKLIIIIGIKQTFVTNYQHHAFYLDGGLNLMLKTLPW